MKLIEIERTKPGDQVVVSGTVDSVDSDGGARLIVDGAKVGTLVRLRKGTLVALAGGASPNYQRAGRPGG